MQLLTSDIINLNIFYKSKTSNNDKEHTSKLSLILEIKQIINNYLRIF